MFKQEVQDIQDQPSILLKLDNKEGQSSMYLEQEYLLKMMNQNLN